MKRELTYEDVSLFSRQIPGLAGGDGKASLCQRVHFGGYMVETGIIMSSPHPDITGYALADLLHVDCQIPVLSQSGDVSEKTGHMSKLMRKHGNRIIAFAVGMDDYLDTLASLEADIETQGYNNLNLLVCIESDECNLAMVAAPAMAIVEFRSRMQGKNIAVEIMAGCIQTIEAAHHLYDLGVRFLRVGTCSSSTQDVFHRPAISALMEVATIKEHHSDCYIVADTGAACGSDIVKSLAADADFVMLDRVLAGYSESNSPVIIETRFSGITEISQEEHDLSSFNLDVGNKYHKRYSAPHPTTENCMVPYKGTMEPFLKSMYDDIRYAFTRSNARNAGEFRLHIEMVEVTLNKQTHR
jgi:hypothetical protein